jgi:hypothetical protein
VGANPDIWYGAYVLNAPTGAILTLEAPVPLTSSAYSDWYPQVASQYSGSGERGARYGIAHQSSFFPQQDILAHAVDALGPGGMWTRATGCGSLTLT